MNVLSSAAVLQNSMCQAVALRNSCNLNTGTVGTETFMGVKYPIGDHAHMVKFCRS